MALGLLDDALTVTLLNSITADSLHRDFHG
jgi:hypothetical protein